MNVNKNKHHSAWWLSALNPYSVLSVRKYTFDIHPEYDLTYFVSYSRRMELNLPTLLAINLTKKMFIAAASSLFISHLHIMAITDCLHDVLAKRIANLFEKTFRHIHRAKKAECSNMQMRV